MNIATLQFQSKSDMLPQYNVPILIKQVDPLLRDGLLKLVDEKTDEILSYPTPEPEKNANWLTSRLWYYNFLNFDSLYTRELKRIIRVNYTEYGKGIGINTDRKLYCQCWANKIYNDGRIIYWHNHAEAHGGAPEFYSYISGHLCLRVENTTTDYKSPFTKEVIQVPNVDCDMTMFPSFLQHQTSQNNAELPRVTIAFDLITEEVYNLLNNPNYIEV